ncbi:MAG: hypothetical protein ACRD97_02660 [Nitrososphaeraceae archaeon]
MAYFCKDILINVICSILSMINIGYEQNIAILLPIIVTLNTVFVSGFIDLDSTAMIISNSINLCEERRTKSSRLPSSHWCRKCSSDSFYLEDTIEITPTSSKPTLCEIYVCDSCGQKIEYWKYFEESRTP